MKAIPLNLSIGFCIVILLARVALPQKKNPTVYPYGGVQDKSRYEEWMERVPLNFMKAYFESAQFKRAADFWYAQFDSLAYFRFAQFDSLAYFESAQFKSQADFGSAQFKRAADFWFAQFKSLAYFRDAQFKSLAYFRDAQFDSLADFEYAQFDSLANFGEAQFDSLVYFTNVTFNDEIDFRGTQFAKSTWVDFSLATIHDTVRVGIERSADIQRYNFLRTKLLPAGKQIIEQMIPATTIKKVNSADSAKKEISADATRKEAKKTFKYPGAKILISGPVELKMQLEKFRFLELFAYLDYYAKKDIISTLKERSFAGENNKQERFELDYIFAKSTMYQKESVNFEQYSWLHPIRWGQFLYNATMGLGYRPFRIIWWVLSFIFAFAAYYFFKIANQVNRYVSKDETPKETSKKSKRVEQSAGNLTGTDTVINCIYFSAMLFFTFRLKRDLLTFFETKEKRIIVFEWLLGFLTYVAFLTLAKSGSILHTLRSLFIG